MIGVLALQGGFSEHIRALNKLGAETFEIRHLQDLDNRKLDGLVLPGGESTVISKLLHETGLFDPLNQCIRQGTPVFGTCAGLILLASQVDDSRVSGFRSMAITAKRNAYGRQLGSFFAESNFAGIGAIPMTFIRAPQIESAKDNVEVLASVYGRTAAARQDNMLVTSFHPELTDSLTVHDYFLKMC